MSPIQAKAEIQRLASEGLPYAQISEELTKQGITSKPINTSTISRIVTKAGGRRNKRRKKAGSAAASRKARTPPASPTRATGAAAKLKAVERILRLSMDAHERIALAQLLIGG